MAIGKLTDEGSLRRFIEQVIDNHNIGTQIRSLISGVRVGDGSPENVVSAPVGTLYRRRDGGAGTSLYVKESGTGNTGWVGK